MLDVVMSNSVKFNGCYNRLTPCRGHMHLVNKLDSHQKVGVRNYFVCQFFS